MPEITSKICVSCSSSCHHASLSLIPLHFVSELFSIPFHHHTVLRVHWPTCASYKQMNVSILTVHPRLMLLSTSIVLPTHLYIAVQLNRSIFPQNPLFDLWCFWILIDAVSSSPDQSLLHGIRVLFYSTDPLPSLGFSPLLPLVLPVHSSSRASLLFSSLPSPAFYSPSPRLPPLSLLGNCSQTFFPPWELHSVRNVFSFHTWSVPGSSDLLSLHNTVHCRIPASLMSCDCLFCAATFRIEKSPRSLAAASSVVSTVPLLKTLFATYFPMVNLPAQPVSQQKLRFPRRCCWWIFMQSSYSFKSPPWLIFPPMWFSGVFASHPRLTFSNSYCVGCIHLCVLFVCLSHQSPLKISRLVLQSASLNV